LGSVTRVVFRAFKLLVLVTAWASGFFVGPVQSVVILTPDT